MVMGPGKQSAQRSVPQKLELTGRAFDRAYPSTAANNLDSKFGYDPPV